MMYKSHVKYIVLLVCALISMPGATSPVSLTIAQASLTPEGGRYAVATIGTQLVVRNVNSGMNNREIYWNEAAPISPYATQCATWTSGVDIAQQGFAFRIARQSGGYNAIVFARNIWLRLYWIFAPKLFHTGSGYASEYDSPFGIDLSQYLGRHEAATYPLRICASLDASDVLRFAVAKESDPMPSLNRPGNQGGSWQLDIARHYHPGEGRTGHNGGVFVGHIPVGTSLTIEGRTPSGQPTGVLS